MALPFPAEVAPGEAQALLARAPAWAVDEVLRRAPDEARRQRIARGRVDKEWFARYYLAHEFTAATPGFHATLDALVAHAETDREKPGTIIAAPRGSAKTTRVALLHVLWSLLYRRHRVIVIASKTQEQADERVQSIRFALETNQRIRADFGDLCGSSYRPVQNWQQSDITICWPRRDAEGRVMRDRAGHPMVGHQARLRGIGTGVSVRGMNKPKRPDLIVCDDLETDEHVSTPAQREKTWGWWSKVIVPLADARTGTLLVVGTILHYDSLLSRLLKQQDDEGNAVYRTAMFRAIEADGTYLWPEVLSPAYLAGMKRRMGTHAFNQEYLNNPLNSDTQVFRPEWFRWWYKHEVSYDHGAEVWRYQGEPLRIFQAVDPALEGEDEFVDITIGVTPGNLVLVLDVFAGHLDFPAQVARLIDLQADWLPVATGVEVTGYQAALAQHVRTKMLAPIRRIQHTGGVGAVSKLRRITAISPYLENGQVLLRAAEPGEPGQLDSAGVVTQRIHPSAWPLWEQMTQYPASAHDDRVDALQMAIETARVRQFFSELGEGAGEPLQSKAGATKEATG